MGLRLFHRDDSQETSSVRNNIVERIIEKVIPPNPNPIEFTILENKVINNKSILLVKYHGCTTFKGQKLLLLKKKWLGGNNLDPHLLGENHLVMARFEPNKQGWKLAKLCAKNS